MHLWVEGVETSAFIYLDVIQLMYVFRMYFNVF